MNGLWLRLYTDTPHCLKLRKLAPSVQLGYIWFLCLHKEGKFLNVSETDLAWTLRVSLAEVHEWIVVLTEVGLLLPDHTPKGWNERQYVSDCSTERVKKHRAKRFRNVSETVPETETETEAENTAPAADAAPPKGTPNRRFVPPTIEEVTAYCAERGKEVNPEKWYAHYSSNGWMVGKNKMRDWRQAVITWEHSEFHKPAQSELPGNIY